MTEKESCPCGRTIFDLSGRSAGDELHCPWCEKDLIVTADGLRLADETVDGGEAEGPRPPGAKPDEEKTLEELLAEEEAGGRARRIVPRASTQPRVAPVGRGGGISEKWFLLLWTAVFITAALGWMLVKSDEHGAYFDWGKYPWWFWAIAILAAALLGLFAQIVYVVFTARGRLQRKRKQAPSGDAGPDEPDA